MNNRISYCRSAWAMLAGLTLTGLCAAPALGVIVSWDGHLGSNNWDAGIDGDRNWDSTLLPATTDDVDFPDAAADFIVDLNGDRTVNSATFSGFAFGIVGYALNGSTLTLTSGNLTSTGFRVHSISSNVVLGAGGTWDIGNTSEVVIDGNVSGGFQLTKAGTGSLTLNSANTYTGGTTVNNGTLLLGLLDALGTGGLNINAGGTVDLDTNTRRVHGDIAINDGTLNLDGTTLDARGSNLSGTTPGHNLTVSGSTGLLNATGSAWINLNGLNSDGSTFSGTNGGSLSVSGGIFNLGPSATLSARGGNGAALFLPGLAGSVSFSGGVSTLDGTLTLEGQFSGFDGGNITVSSAADVTLTGTMDLRGSQGRNGTSFGANGEDGGDGGMLLIQGGNFTLNNSNAIVNLLPGAGGLGNNGGTDGLSGAPGSIDLSGGTLTLTAGVIRGGMSMLTLDPIHLIGSSINVNGGDLIATAAMTLRGNAAINLSAGSVTATSIKNISSHFNFTGGTLTVDTFLGSLTQDGGSLVPGASAGTTSIAVNYVMNAGALAIELGGLTAGTQFDQLLVGSNATLNPGTTLDISLINSFVPTIGDSFLILDATGSLTGTFDTVLFPSIPGVGLGVLYDATTVTLLAGLAGDLNADGFVGIADLNIVLGSWNQNVNAGVWGLGDPSGDGFIGIEDLNAVLGNWNAGTPPGGQPAATVPEPAALTVLALGVTALLRRRSTRRD